MTRVRTALLMVLALALGALPCGPARADKGNSGGKGKGAGAQKAPAAPTVSIEDFKTWKETHGKTVWTYWSWKVVTKYPAGSKSGGSLSGQQRAAYEQKRKDFNSTERAAYWKSWAKFIDSEIARGSNLNGGQFKLPGGNFNVFRPYQGQSRHKGLGNNLDLMRAGRAPIGADGKAVNLHHLQSLRYGGSNMFENVAPLTATYHQRNHQALHSRPADVVTFTLKLRTK